MFAAWHVARTANKTTTNVQEFGGYDHFLTVLTESLTNRGRECAVCCVVLHSIGALSKVTRRKFHSRHVAPEWAFPSAYIHINLS